MVGPGEARGCADCGSGATHRVYAHYYEGRNAAVERWACEDHVHDVIQRIKRACEGTRFRVHVEEVTSNV